ncbi:MAG: FAD-dependent oxidoreductase [Alphaproteobacteria bacterium]|nr:FAD-dependent oxidoreductase [Alphaproteobacteria bacterium]
MNQDAEIVIVGAGLTGLALAHALRAEGRNLVVLEARDRAGGRVLSQDGYDLGPAWIWPHNRRMLGLARQLGVQSFPQHSDGRLIFEDASGNVRSDLEFATMGGALRLAGGIGRITDALARGLGDTLRLGYAVERVIEDSAGVTLSGDGFSVRAERTVLALPLRITAGFGLSVPDAPTWMAGHAKLVAVFDRPFWRDVGLNGDAISHRGPLAEIHDASPADATVGALFGFATPGAVRQAGFEADAVEQLGRLFGPDAAKPDTILVKDWSADPATATSADRTPPISHPHYRPVAPTDRILFAGSETAPTEGGFLEGALESAEAAYRQLSIKAA